MATYQGLTGSMPGVKTGIRLMIPQQGIAKALPGITHGTRVTRVSYGYSLSTKEVERAPISKPRTFPLEWKAVAPTT